MPAHELAAAASVSSHTAVTVIEPRTGWRMLDWRELWAYRELLWVLTTRDIKVRYKQTFLGAGWAILRPIMAMAIFSVVFGQFARIPSDGLPYPLFVYAGLLPWTFFAGATATAGQSLLGSAHLVSKVYFPRLIIPFASVGASLVDLLISTGVLLAMMAWYGASWTANLLLAPMLVVLLTFLSMAIGTLLAALTVQFRDFTHITPFIIQIWMYATPVVFPASLVPDRWRWLLFVNPMAGVVDAFRSCFLGKPFDWASITVSAAAALLIFIVAAAYFERLERRFADII